MYFFCHTIGSSQDWVLYIDKLRSVSSTFSLDLSAFPYGIWCVVGGLRVSYFFLQPISRNKLSVHRFYFVVSFVEIKCIQILCYGYLPLMLSGRPSLNGVNLLVIVFTVCRLTQTQGYYPLNVLRCWAIGNSCLLRNIFHSFSWKRKELTLWNSNRQKKW